MAARFFFRMNIIFISAKNNREGDIMKKEEKNKPEYDPTPSVTTVYGDPETCMELLNKYGTYNIQPTAESDNEFPAIAHGYPETPKKER